MKFVFYYILKLILVFVVYKHTLFTLMLYKNAFYQRKIPARTGLKAFGNFILLLVLIFIHFLFTASIITDENNIFLLLNSSLLLVLLSIIIYRKKYILPKTASLPEIFMAVVNALAFYMIFTFNAFETDIRNRLLILLNAIAMGIWTFNEYQKRFHE